jgi:uncharacterized surface anchored protein
MRRKLAAVFLVVFSLLLMPMTAFAQTIDFDRKGSISVTLIDQNGKKPITGVELSLYYVANVSLNSKNNLSYTFTNIFEDCGVTLDDPTLSVVLDAFVENHYVSAEKLVTDAYGNASFTNLPLGLYFVKQTNAVAGYAPCTSFLVTVPNRDTNGYVYDVNASPKTDVARPTTITIRKVWNTDASAAAADHVTVQLLRAGTVVEIATLSEQNDWQVTYTDLPESDAYSVVEVDVPNGFTATYSKNGYVFTVTNTASLIQTGQLVWPIPILAMVGLSLVTVGTIVLRKSRNKNA